VEYDREIAQTAAVQLSTDAEPYPPPFLLAAYLSVVEYPAETVTYCSSWYEEDSSAASWSLLALVGDSVVRIVTTGPTVNDEAPRSPVPQATSLQITVYPFAAIESVSVAIDQLVVEFANRGLTWRRLWSVHFAGGDRFDMPGASERDSGSGERADRLASAILSRLRTGRNA
jgi:hypothetical protein